MLPFTKRPGRDESEDNDVVTKDDLITAETRTPASLREGRGKFASINDEEMTTLMPTKTIGDAVAAAKAAQIASPRPAAGAPPPSHAVPSSRAGAGTVPPSPASRSGKFAAQEDEEEDGRTVVRGAPKIVKRSSATSPPNSARGAKMGGMNTMPTTISPAAVIKATLESARAGVKPRTDRLMAGPPQDLLEDLADMQVHPSDVGSEHTAILKSPNSSNVPPPMIQGVRALSTQAMQPQAMPHGTIPPGSSRPLTGPPPPNSNQSGGYAAQSGGYAAQYNGPVPSGSVSVPGVSMSQSMPAHFMVPHAPYSDARIDPPGTVVTSRMKVAGRPATSWAMALAAFGIFVGVGAAAVLNGNDGMKETSASFVDPSRAAGGPGARNAAGAQPAVPGAPTAVPVVGANDQPATVGVPPVAVPAATEAAAAPVVTTHAPAVPAATVPPAGMLAAAPAPVAAPPARPAAVAAAAPRAAAPAAAPRAPRPAPQAAAAADDAPVAAAPAAKSGKGGKGAAKPGGDMDDETKKALDELQKAQLERSF